MLVAVFGEVLVFAQKQKKNLLSSRAQISTCQAQEKHRNPRLVI